MHNWTDTYIERAPWYIHLFWVLQYIASMVLSPQFIWSFYRVMKRGIAVAQDYSDRFRHITKHVATVPMVIAQPKTAKRSGVYKRKYAGA